MTETAAERSDRSRMPLGQHVREARTRLIRAGLVVGVGIVLGYLLSEPILEMLRAPVVELATSRNASLNYDSVTGAFDLRLRLALIAGFVVSAPFWLYEVLAFLVPALTRRERRYLFGFFGAALPLFGVGCVFGLTLFPHMVELLAGFASTEDSTILSATSYVDFVLKIVLVTGIGFVLPLFLVALNFVGILSARTMLKGWRIAVVAVTVFSALVTPAADVVTMVLVAVPVCALYFAAVGVAALHDRRALRAAAREQREQEISDVRIDA